jgi:hypothetical protein
MCLPPAKPKQLNPLLGYPILGYSADHIRAAEAWMSYQQTGEAGVGGWLRLLILILCFATPLTGIVSLTNDLAAAEHVSPQILNSPRWLDAKLLLWVSLALRSTGLFYAGWRLSAVHRWSSVRVALLLLWIAGPIAIAITNLMVSGQLGQQELGSPTPLGWPIASAIVWSAYLLSSARVAVTYLPQGEEQQATDQVRMRSYPHLNLTVRRPSGFVRCRPMVPACPRIRPISR